MERRGSRVAAADQLYLDRAVELACRAIENTPPNPAVGAVLVRDGAIIGEGYHHRAGESHAEIEALRGVRDARGATLFVSLEPCNHHGRTPPCTQAIIDAHIARVVVGTRDPNPKTAGGGISALQSAGIEVEVADDPAASNIVERFRIAITRNDRPYLAVKMAASLDGFIASSPGKQQWLTGDRARGYVRELRIAHDAVMVGAGTIRIDNPQLTVRPAHVRAQPYLRIVVCETDSIEPDRIVLQPQDGYAKTIVLAPCGVRERFGALERVAEVMYVGDAGEKALDLRAAMQALRERGIASVLCEGGPTLATRLIELGLADRLYWLIAPQMLGGSSAVRVLRQPERGFPSISFDAVEMLEPDILLTGTFTHV